MERCHDRDAADELRNHAEFDQVFGFEIVKDGRTFAFGFYLDLSVEPHRAANRQPTLDHFVHSEERPTPYEEDVRGIDLPKLLMRMFSASLGRNISNSALEHLQESLLD